MSISAITSRSTKQVNESNFMISLNTIVFQVYVFMYFFTILLCLRRYVW